jgi:hypothetical protein
MDTGHAAAADRREEARKEIIGEILWGYASDDNHVVQRGVITDESRSGLSIFTLSRIKAGTILKIYLRRREGVRLATAVWCREVLPDIYRSGLLLCEAGETLQAPEGQAASSCRAVNSVVDPKR